MKYQLIKYYQHIQSKISLIQKYFLVALIIIGILLIIVQHQYVDMYFDDYGYASISYNFDNNAKQMSYGFREIFQF